MLKNKNLAGVLLALVFSMACGIFQPAAIVESGGPPTQVIPTQIPPTAEATLPPTVTYPPLTIETLRNASYHSPDFGDFQLTDGVYYRSPLAPGESPEIYTTQMNELVVFGDLNADGVEDAIVFLYTQNGGTGHFLEMAAMINQGGAALNISTIYLGDRDTVMSAQILDGILSMEIRFHGPNDPLCCASQVEQRRYQLENGQLTRLSVQ